MPKTEYSPVFCIITVYCIITEYSTVAFADLRSEARSFWLERTAGAKAPYPFLSLLQGLGSAWDSVQTASQTLDSLP